MSEKVNDFLSDWLDDEEPTSSDKEDAIVEDSSELIADSLLIHGLLADIGGRDHEQETQNLRGVMKRIDSESDSKTVIRRFLTLNCHRPLLG